MSGKPNTMKYLSTLSIILLAATAAVAQKADFDKKLKDLGITLTEPSKPIANYVKAVRSGNLIFLAGHGPVKADGSYVTGKVGRDLTIEQGYEAARLTVSSCCLLLKQKLVISIK